MTLTPNPPRLPKAALLSAAFLAGALLALMAGVLLKPAQAMPAQPTEDPSTLPTPVIWRTPAPSPTAAAVVNPTALIPTVQPGPLAAPVDLPVVFGWPGEIRCYNCAPFTVKVFLHHYNPMEGDFNCFTWSEEFQYCMSPTSSWFPWESVWGFGAACPIEWPHGTWVIIPEVGAFICFDHGDLIYCQDGTCNVDLLGPGGQAWDGKEFEATIWVPLKPRKEGE